MNWEEWGLYDYLQVVKVPMDLGTIRNKLAKNEYKKAAEFARDVRLVWDNCKLYNQVKTNCKLECRSTSCMENVQLNAFLFIFIYLGRIRALRHCGRPLEAL